MTDSAAESTEQEPRFCSQCGYSLLPLDTPHVARGCERCEKTIHLVEPSDGGKGIRIRKGDQFNIPAGFLKFSLDPQKGGKLFRPGLRFLMDQLFYAGRPEKPQEMPSLLELYRSLATDILKSSPLLEGLDPEKESDGDEILARLERQEKGREWYALLMGTFAAAVENAVEKGEATEAAWAGYNAAIAHSMVVGLDPTFELTLWRGYLANQVVYEAASAAAQTPAEAEAIRLLEPRFRGLDEATIHTWVHDGRPIGERLSPDVARACR